MKLLGKKTEKSRCHLLSPFDNLVIQRKRLFSLFGFDYTIECYLPEAKRRYGYFVLPILYGGSFAGRMDVKADRAKKVLKINSLHFEKGFVKEDGFITEFKNSVLEFALFNSCEKISPIKGIKFNL